MLSKVGSGAGAGAWQQQLTPAGGSTHPATPTSPPTAPI